jgi:hypothetical protein
MQAGYTEAKIVARWRRSPANELTDLHVRAERGDDDVEPIDLDALALDDGGDEPPPDLGVERR